MSYWNQENKYLYDNRNFVPDNYKFSNRNCDSKKEICYSSRNFNNLQYVSPQKNWNVTSFKNLPVASKSFTRIKQDPLADVLGNQYKVSPRHKQENIDSRKSKLSSIKQEPFTDVLGNQYIVSPSQNQENMDSRKRHLPSIKQEPFTDALKNQGLGSPSKKQIKMESKKINLTTSRKSSPQIKKEIIRKNKIVIKQEPIGPNFKDETSDESDSPPVLVKAKGRKRNAVNSIKVKKQMSVKTDNDNIKLETRCDDEDYVDSASPPKRQKVAKKGVKVKPGTSKENEHDLKFDLKTENDIKLLNKVFQSDMKKKRQCFILSEVLNLSFDLTARIMDLFDSDATIPFIVRYRQHLIENHTAEELRNFKHNYDYLSKVFDKAETLKKKLQALGHLDETLSNAIDMCTTLQELEYINEPYKVTKSSKLVKVIDSGLVGPATEIFNGTSIVNIDKIKKPQGMKENEVLDLIIYYICETMSKDTELIKKVQEIKKTERILLTCKQKKESSSSKSSDQKKKRPEDNYFTYYNFSQRIDRVKPYQVLAMNRGEKEKYLQVSILIEDSFRYKLTRFAFEKWFNKRTYYELRKNIFNKAIDFMFNHRIVPHIKRVIRSELTKEGEKASLEVFSSNLKYLLLTPPMHNVIVCAIDPGFNNGCKIAVLNPKQEILTTDILYLHLPRDFALADCKLVRLMTDYNVDLVAVGNGKGCREVESCLSKLVNNNFLSKNFKHIVVNERGVSIYSCSSDAKEDYPNYSPNVISAISLAKRVLDPLCEMVKVDPKHLGVGMYQHDISEKKLALEVDEVVSECVSNVGVDINNAPLRILKRVAGLTESRAKAIIDAREKIGSFINRNDLKDVKGIGPKTFQQCAGFIKIIPGTILTENKKSKLKTNYFDQTIVHPEDYNSAKKLLSLNKLNPENIGNVEFINKLTSFMRSQDLTLIAKDIGVPIETLKQILEALIKPIDYDIRSNLDKPIFRSGAKSINDLQQNSVLIGQVENVTHFGAFVDIGIECCGLIPTTFCQGKTLHLGQKVTVRVGEIDPQKMRVSLHLQKIDSYDD